MDPLQIILIAAITFLIFGIVLLMLQNKSTSQKQKNIDLIRGGKHSENHTNEKDLQHKRRAEIAKKLKSSKDDDKKEESSKVSIDVKLKQAGLSAPPSRFWMLSVVCGLLFCLLYTSPSPRDQRGSRMPSSA